MRSIDILMIEDNYKDIELIKNVLGAQKINLRFFTVRDADNTLQFLRQEGIYNLMPTPDLILLDWKLSTFELGEQLLMDIKKIPRCKASTVVLMSAYLHRDDAAVKRIIQMGAACCIEKPLTLDRLHEIVSVVPDFWFTIVRAQSAPY